MVGGWYTAVQDRVDPSWIRWCRPSHRRTCGHPGGTPTPSHPVARVEGSRRRVGREQNPSRVPLCREEEEYFIIIATQHRHTQAVAVPVLFFEVLDSLQHHPRPWRQSGFGLLVIRFVQCTDQKAPLLSGTEGISFPMTYIKHTLLCGR